jgi:hypothetical protein
MKIKHSVALLPVVLGLLCFSGLVLLVQVSLFHDLKNTGFYLLQDLAFLPIQVLLVTLILNAMLVRHEKTERLKKMNMVIGAFVFEIGTPLLKYLVQFDRNTKDLAQHLQLSAHWSESDFKRAFKTAQNHSYDFDCFAGNLQGLKDFLSKKRESLLRLLENPNLLEHEDFSDLLWAVNHLTDELLYRQDVVRLSAPDANHLEEDMRRAAVNLLSGWLSYLAQIQADYPFLYSLVVRTNPFNPESQVEVG